VKRLLFIFLFITAFAAQSNCQQTKEEYLRENSSALDINDNNDFSSFAMLDTVLDRYTVFFTGEMHWTTGNFELRWKMLQYFYRKAGVRVLFVEAPRSFTYLLNYYIDAGDSIHYENVLQYATQGTKERIYYMNLYHFNRGKKPSERIIIRGLDRDTILTL
jgi:hypothetical protein